MSCSPEVEAQFLTEVCHNVGTEPQLQVSNSPYKLPTEDGACLDIAIPSVLHSFTVEHAFICTRGGFPFICHNELRDITAGLLTA